MKPLFTSILFLSFLSLNPILAETITVSGDVSGTWSADTVLVVGEVRVPTDSTLTIEPGVKVIFQGHYKLIVDTLAILLAVGTEQDSILFTAADTSEGWHGIRFIDAPDTSKIIFCQIQFGRAEGDDEDDFGGGIYCSGSSLVIQHSLVQYCSATFRGGGIYCNNSDPIIDSNTIRFNTVGINSPLGPYQGGGGICCFNSEALIIANNIKGNYCSLYGRWGGGIYCRFGSPIIESNNIVENWSPTGGGIACNHQTYPNSPTIINNNISDNEGLGSVGISNSFADPIICGNIIEGNNGNGWGGGISCNVSSPIIIGNIIINNSNISFGGGIMCDNVSTPYISTNYIMGNSAYHGGGIGMIDDADPHILNNLILGNVCSHAGGGIYTADIAHPNISGNFIIDNSAGTVGGGVCLLSEPDVFDGNQINSNVTSTDGGGIYLGGASPEINGNVVLMNEAEAGAGIYCDNASPIINTCMILRNSTTGSNGFGGGIHCVDSNPTVNSCTISMNSATYEGGGIWCVFSSDPVIINGIIWANAPEQICGSSQITYCDIQNSWPGLGNIADYPAFVDTTINDYRLQWDSPCIDAGDPDPQYNDPDSTRADMGAFYFDQSVPVRILLSPHEIPYLIEPEGGTMDYTIRGENIEDVSHSVTIWCDVTLPDSSVYGPVLGPVTVTIEPGQTVERIRTQTVPSSAPMGVYHYNAYAVVDQDTSKDSFMFGKLGTSVGGIDGWGNAGDPLIDIGGGSTPALRTGYALLDAFPNPFNPVTTIRFELPVGSWVRLEVFDISGRRVPTSGSGTTPTTALVDGWRDAGAHEVTFDASRLASGIYIYRLDTGLFTASGKMVLMK